MSKPSDGAMRAVSAILREILGSHEWFHSNKTLMAEIIDRETEGRMIWPSKSNAGTAGGGLRGARACAPLAPRR